MNTVELQSPLARATDPLSSHLAAADAPLFSGRHHDRIMASMQRRGRATALQISIDTKLTVVQVDRRVHELIKTGQLAAVEEGGIEVMVDKYRLLELGKNFSPRPQQNGVVTTKTDR